MKTILDKTQVVGLLFTDYFINNLCPVKFWLTSKNKVRVRPNNTWFPSIKYLGFVNYFVIIIRPDEFSIAPNDNDEFVWMCVVLGCFAAYNERPYSNITKVFFKTQ